MAVRYDHAGGAITTTLGADITSGSLTITIASATGWPSGGAAGPFFVVIDKGLAGEEKIEVQSRTGTTLTVAGAGQRGVDGSSATSHLTGATVQHVFVALEAHQASEHAGNPAQGVADHTTLLDAARHLSIVHTAAMLGTDSVGSDEIQANAVGASELANDAVDTAAIANLAVTAAKIATDTITATQIAADAVGTSELGPLAVTSAELAADAVTAGKIADGAVDTSATLANAIVTLAKFASEAGTSFTPTFSGNGAVTLGTGGTSYGRTFKLGRLVFGIAGFFLGTGGNVPGSDPFFLRLTLPFPPFNVAGLAGDNTGWVTAGRAYDASADTTFSGLGIIRSSDDVAFAWVTAGASAEWDGLTPFNWDVNDIFQCLFVYEAES